MTEANQKTLYEHYIATGQTKRAAEVLSVYPQFGEKKVEAISKEKKVK